MNTNSAKPNSSETLQVLNTWPVAISMSCLLFIIVILQGIFNSISELYFPYAYEAVVFPYTIYVGLYMWSKIDDPSKGFNPYRPPLMTVAFMMLFTPAFYLLLTEQV